jgi:hypothetical protein
MKLEKRAKLVKAMREMLNKDIERTEKKTTKKPHGKAYDN